MHHLLGCDALTCIMMRMRTTLELPDDLHQQAKAIAETSQRPMGVVVAELIRRGLRHNTPAPATGHSNRSGFPTMNLDHPVTAEDVRSLEDVE